jgi:hypothetical protein
MTDQEIYEHYLLLWREYARVRDTGTPEEVEVLRQIKMRGGGPVETTVFGWPNRGF